MRHTSYHKILRIAALTLALILIFDSGLFVPVTRELSQHTQDYIATAIGMNASVTPTELNQVTAALTERNRVLTQRENDLAEREISVTLQEQGGTSSEFSIFLISILLFIILVLIVVNYVLDYMRIRNKIIKTTNEKVA